MCVPIATLYWGRAPYLLPHAKVQSKTLSTFVFLSTRRIGSLQPSPRTVICWYDNVSLPGIGSSRPFSPLSMTVESEPVTKVDKNSTESSERPNASSLHIQRLENGGAGSVERNNQEGFLVPLERSLYQMYSECSRKSMARMINAKFSTAATLIVGS